MKTRITRMSMTGFKSFGRKTDIEFGDSFNCILGPNGSGKSNVIDALTFVLGKSGSKGLRAEKTANLIYNGGKLKNPSKEGSVTIWFDNNYNDFSIDEKEVKITRLVKPTGNSIYKINDKTVTRTQVLELLSSARINPDGYNIILQGDIVHLVEMSSIERRQIIEEVSGLSIYEDRKNKALRDLTKVEEKLNEAEIILAERKTYIKELKKDRDQAFKFKELDEKIKRNKVTSLSSRKKGKSKQLDDFENKNKSSKEIIKKYNDEINELKQKIEVKKNEIEEINQKVEESGEKAQVEVHKHVEQLKIDLALNNQRLDNLHSELEKIKSRKNEFQESLKEYTKQTSEFKKEQEKYEKEIKQKEKIIEEITKKINSFKEKNKLDENIDQEVVKIDIQSEEKQSKLEKLREEQQGLIREKDKLEFNLNSIDEKINKVLEVAKENKDQIELLKIKKQKFKEITIQLSKSLNDDAEFASQLSTARSKLLSRKEEYSKLNAKNSMILEKRYSSQSVKTIIENKNKFPGVIGTVSDLGSVKSEYSTALETAAGARIRSIVTENDEIAAYCINFLKDKRMGVATFLPLNKLRSVLISSELRNLKANGIHGLAIDLVSFDKKYEKVFQQVFGNTLVVENINTARRLGIGKTRMVTLEGDIVETSGSMTGGYRQKQAIGGFKEEELSKSLEDLNHEISDLEIVVSNLEEKRKGLEELIQKLRTEKAELEGDIIKMEKSLHIDSSDMNASTDLKNKIELEIKDIDLKIESNNENIILLTRELTQLKIKKQELRNKISQMRDPTLLAELNSFEEKKQELKEEISNLNAKIKSQVLQEESVLGREIENIQKILKQQEKEETEFNKEIKLLSELIKDQNKELKEKEKHQKEFYAKFKDLFNKRQKINDEISKLENQINNKEEKSRSEEIKINNISLEIAKLKAEIAGLDEELNHYPNIKSYNDKSLDNIEKEIRDFERMKETIGSVNMRALEIYEKAEVEYNNLVDKKTKLTKEREDVLVMINEIESKKKELFMKTFNGLKEEFKKIFERLMTKSADSELVLEDSNDPFNGGLEIKVKLSGKKFLDLRSLSGGEKTMTALAFLFAVQEYEPASFYCLDEVDAALDKRNSEKLASLVRSYSEKAQYIMISHNDGVITEADNLYGISMDEHGISKITSLKI